MFCVAVVQESNKIEKIYEYGEMDEHSHKNQVHEPNKLEKWLKLREKDAQIRCLTFDHKSFYVSYNGEYIGILTEPEYRHFLGYEPKEEWTKQRYLNHKNELEQQTKIVELRKKVFSYQMMMDILEGDFTLEPIQENIMVIGEGYGRKTVGYYVVSGNDKYQIDIETASEVLDRAREQKIIPVKNGYSVEYIHKPFGIGSPSKY